MKRFIYITIYFCSLFSISGYGQENIPDTILIWTDKIPVLSTTTEHYVIKGTREMIIRISDEKRDTTFYEKMCEQTFMRYPERLRIISLRALPIEKIDADMALDYFSIGDSIEYVTKRLGNKKIHVYESGYKVPFYNKFSKKNEIIDLKFIDGKLCSISRPSTNTLPTNNLWTAFQLLKLEDSLKDLKSSIEKLNKKIK